MPFSPSNCSQYEQSFTRHKDTQPDDAVPLWDVLKALFVQRNMMFCDWSPASKEYAHQTWCQTATFHSCSPWPWSQPPYTVILTQMSWIVSFLMTGFILMYILLNHSFETYLTEAKGVTIIQSSPPRLFCSGLVVQGNPQKEIGEQRHFAFSGSPLMAWKGQEFT